MTDTTAGEGFRKRLQASIRRAGGITVLCRTTESRKRLIDLICNEVAAQPSAGAQGEWLFRLSVMKDRYEIARDLDGPAILVVPGHDTPEQTKHKGAVAVAALNECRATLPPPITHDFSKDPSVTGNFFKHWACEDDEYAPSGVAAQPDTGDVAALREIEADIRKLCNGHPHAKIEWPHRDLHAIADILAALSKPNAPGREG